MKQILLHSRLNTLYDCVSFEYVKYLEKNLHIKNRIVFFFPTQPVHLYLLRAIFEQKYGNHAMGRLCIIFFPKTRIFVAFAYRTNAHLELNKNNGLSKHWCRCKCPKTIFGQNWTNRYRNVQNWFVCVKIETIVGVHHPLKYEDHRCITSENHWDDFSIPLNYSHYLQKHQHVSPTLC